MTKRDLVLTVAEKIGFTRVDVGRVIEETVEAISVILENKGKVTIRGFGTFSPKLRKAKMGRNPFTGGTMAMPERTVAHFKPAMELKFRVNKS